MTGPRRWRPWQLRWRTRQASFLVTSPAQQTAVKAPALTEVVDEASITNVILSFQLKHQTRRLLNIPAISELRRDALARARCRAAQVRAHNAELITRAYTSIAPDKAAALLGLTKAQAAERAPHAGLCRGLSMSL